MAATVSAWGKPGSWSLDAEENDSEFLHQRNQDSSPVNGLFNGTEQADYPSLAAAASTKTKKKKPQTLSLQEFSTYSAAKASASQSKGLTSEELMMLPTGPRERSAEELDRNKLGGGFRSYGGGARDDQPRRQGGFNRDSNREFMPSRADENDNWGAGKKLPANNGFELRDRGGFFTDSQSRADDVDNWASKKSYMPSEPKKYEKRGGFGMESGGADSNTWLKRKEEDCGKIGGSFDSLRDRKGGFDNGPDAESWGTRRNEGTDGGRPRLMLQPRTLPVGEEKKSDSGNMAKPKGSNPFGAARPREEVLKEKGHDWKEIEEKLQAPKTKESAVAGSGDALLAEKRNFWSGRERLQQQDDKTERTWKKPDSCSLRSPCPQNSANEPAEEAEVKGD